MHGSRSLPTLQSRPQGAEHRGLFSQAEQASWSLQPFGRYDASEDLSDALGDLREPVMEAHSETQYGELAAMLAASHEANGAQIEQEIWEMFCGRKPKRQDYELPDVDFGCGRFADMHSKSGLPAAEELVVRQCVCGCGEKRLCDRASHVIYPEIEAIRQRLKEMPGNTRQPRAVVASQREGCRRLMQRRGLARAPEPESEVPKRRIDRARLAQLAAPREKPEPEDEPYVMPPPRPAPRRPAGEPLWEGLATSSSFGHAPPPPPEPLQPLAALRCSRVKSSLLVGPSQDLSLEQPLSDLRCNQAKSALLAGPPQDLSLDELLGPPRAPRRTAKTQQEYTKDRLYVKPKFMPGSNEALKARLQALRKETRALEEESRRLEEERLNAGGARPSRARRRMARSRTDSSLSTGSPPAAQHSPASFAIAMEPEELA